jgi:hypothetical protein
MPPTSAKLRAFAGKESVGDLDQTPQHNVLDAVDLAVSALLVPNPLGVGLDAALLEMAAVQVGSSRRVSLIATPG